ncbi:10239_t:CDS:2 [Funneliformis caledonium]|uniref:10239_t:CDS:1 n=1 Tax=Funneliformis caledonium TaxID=1117310 RepID=A0A9N9BMR0_9GLOM|nr:10239_t:CDS:2 [Funneliformis caledonium]
MKPFSLISTCLFFSLTLFSISSTSAQCIDQPSPIKPRNKMAVACSMVKQPKKNLKFHVSNETNMFDLQFFCEIQDKALCAKAKSSFEEAGRIITSTLILNTPIIINATFQDMEDPGILGAAGPLRSIPMKDDDGIERLYPQALVKQFQLGSHPEFAPVDIVADFNSLVPFWFEGDPPITNKQIGFLELILHELMHGLGFNSAWSDNFPQAATPEIIGLTTEPGITDLNATIVFRGFQERALDKYLILLPDNKTTAFYANELNKFANGSTFKNVDDFSDKFIASPQYLVGKEIFSYFVTPKSLVFKPSVSDKEEDMTYLETSLNPFERGSSISHVDIAMYTNTSEFLMTYLQESGRTLNDSIRIGGNFAGGAIGYKLRLILESLGYATRENPKPYNPSPPVFSTDKSNINTSSRITFSCNIYLAFAVGITMIISIL